MICPPNVRAALREMVLADCEDADTGKSRTEHIIDMHWPRLLDALRAAMGPQMAKEFDDMAKTMARRSLAA